MIDDPPSKGVTHEILTFVPSISVVGVLTILGLVAATIEMTSEASPSPSSFLPLITNLYVVPVVNPVFSINNGSVDKTL